MSRAPRRKDLTGQKFGSITVLSFSRSIRVNKWRYKTYWNCIDDFGVEQEVLSSYLLSGQKKSCIGLNKLHQHQHPRWKGYGELCMGYFYMCRHGAKKRCIPFEITIEDAWRQFVTQDRKCALSGIPLTLYKSNLNKEWTASLDRIDSSKGYTRDNIQWIHKTLNTMKNDLSMMEFVEWCKKIVEYEKKSCL